MTAIAGLIRLDGTAIDRATMDRMQAQLTPYGRDAQHQWRHEGAGLLRTLLRITPEDSLDMQPLHHQPSQTVLLFDGRLDNREELSHELGTKPQDLALMADSDLALRACLRWDTATVDHLLGDFALACWQPQRKRLWLARDPIGHRPLFWHHQPNFFAFATMPKALFAVPGVPRELCEEMLHDKLCLLPTVGPASFYQNVYRIEQGQLLILDDGRVTTRQYHRFNSEREIHLARDDDYVDALGEHLDRAVTRRLRSSRGIASHLSSGFDSSTVTAVAARILEQQGKGLLAYTAVPRKGFTGPVAKGRHADEGPGARALASRFTNIEHILIHSESKLPLDILRDLTESSEKAQINTLNSIWGEAIRRDAAARGANVLLTGQMGNMSISYNGAPYLPALLGRGHLIKWWREASAYKHTHPQNRWLGIMAQSLGPYLPATIWRALAHRRGLSPSLENYTPINPAFMLEMRSETRATNAGWDLSYRPWSNGRKMRIAVIKRNDSAEHFAMANIRGLEVRDPTSDLQLLEFCLAVPEHQYLRNGQTAWLLRRLMGDVLPPEILQARTKGFQSADWFEAIQSELPQIRAELQSMKSHQAITKYLDIDALLQSLDDLPQQGWATSRIRERYALKLLRGLSWGLHIRYVDPRNE